MGELGGMAVGRSIIAGRLDGNGCLIHRRLLLVWSFAYLMGFAGPAPGEYFCATYNVTWASQCTDLADFQCKWLPGK